MRIRVSAFHRCCLGVVLGLTAAGCGSVPFTVSATRYRAPAPEQRTYRIVNETKLHKPGDPSFSHLTTYVRTGLAEHGLHEPASGHPADLIISVGFEQDAPRIAIRTETQNVFEWQPEQTVLKTKQTKLDDGVVLTEKVPTRVAAHSESVGQRTIVYRVKVFPKRLRIVCNDQASLAEDSDTPPLWSVEVRNEDQIGDLDGFLPLMVAAAMQYAGENSAGEKIVIVSRHDQRTKLLLRQSVTAERAVAQPR